MANWLEQKYVAQLASSLYNFSTGKTHFRFSCPVCNEYETSSSKRKARGYLLDRGDHYSYFCHRCGASSSFSQFLRDQDASLYQEFVKERLKESGRTRRVAQPQPKFAEVKRPDSSPLRRIQKVSRLDHDHPCRTYVDGRHIPEEHVRNLYFAPRFMEWINTIIPDKFSDRALKQDGPRLVIPFIDSFGKFHAVQGRSLEKDSSLRYITLVIDESVPSIYGLDRYDPRLRGYVTEGPIDSMFLPNGIATAGGDIASKLSNFDKNMLTVVYDNERRSATTLTKTMRAIKDGFSVCVWPSNVKEKDVNDMVMGGLNPVEIIENNTYSGMRATLALKEWTRA